MGDDMNKKIKTLIVDDNRVDRLMLSTKMQEMSHDIVLADSGEEALELLEQQKDIDLVILDRSMDGIDGMKVVEIMKQDPVLHRTPIIMVTGHDNVNEIKEGIDAGVFYYLSKPIDDGILSSIVGSAERDIARQRVLKSELMKHKDSFSLIKKCEMEYKTISEAENIAVFIANCYPDKSKVVFGIAKLLSNAVEHGNLSISYDEKTRLLAEGNLQEEIARRQGLPEYSKRKVVAVFKREEDGLYLKITDEGAGFNWRKYIEVDPSRALDSHGRGIAQIKSECFDEIVYNDLGNEVVAIVRDSSDIEW